MWIMDDGTISGSREDVRSTIAIIENDGPERGLLLNKSKSLVWTADPSADKDDPNTSSSSSSHFTSSCEAGKSKFSGRCKVHLTGGDGSYDLQRS